MHMKAQMEVHKTGAYIKSLSLRGFKSFGGDAQTITFSKGMNLIAGANGSGKSNILDAICFALCERTSSLRVHHICEVQSSDTDEPCEVALEIANETTHATQVITSLSVKLLPDGASRQIKLDGKLKALKEVKEFLREKRLLLEETSAVLYQSRVTELADKNSASVLAAIISGASGAGRWNEEVDKTQQELKKVRKGLEEIKDNIVTLEKAISEDNERVKSISRLNELTIKMTNLSIRLSNYQKNKLMQLKENICEQTELMKFKETCIQEQQLRLQTRQASIIAMRKSEQALIEQLRKDRSSLLDQLAIKEGEKESIEKKIEDAEKNKKELDHYSRTEGNMQAKISLLEAQLKEKQARGAIVNGDQRLQELQCQEDMVTKELQKLVRMKLLKEKERFNIQQDYEQWMPNSPDISSQITSASQSFDNFMEIRAYLKTRQVELDRELQILGSQLGHLSADEQALPAWPLHACFKFKAHEYGDINFRTPLGVISGSLKRVCITKTTAAASELLQIWEHNKFTKFSHIWPLDRLKVAEKLEYQRHVQRKYPVGSVILPVDLIKHDELFDKAIKRAFGNYVISTSDDVAKDLVLRYGIPNVSVDGKINNLGSVSGGWLEESKNTFIHAKAKMDATEDELMNISSQLKDVEKEAKVSQDTLNELQGVKAKMDAFTKTTILLEKEMESLIVEELRQKNLHAEIKERKFLLEEDIKKSRWKLRNLSGDAAETAEDNAIKALENEISEEKALQETIHDLMLQQKQVELLHRRLLGNLQDSDVTMMHHTINLYNEDLANLKGKLTEVEHKLDHANKEDEERSEQLRMIIEEADLSEQMISEAEEDIMHLKTRIEQLKASQNETEEEIKSLEVSQELTGFSNGCVITTEHNYRVGKQQLKRMTLELQKLKSGKQKLTLKEQVAYDECVMQLSIFKERAASISESMNILIEGIEKTKNRVQEANEATFDAIRHSFTESCKMLLPNMSVDLIKIGKLVEHGVKMSFRNHSAKSSDANDHHWKQNLEELSGGQRTMMCLAFILMVAKSQQASLYIMDEVDAALDEQNQTRIAALIRKYIGDKSQVICVSHNVSFQKHCDTILTISKQEGTVILQRTELESVAQADPLQQSIGLFAPGAGNAKVTARRSKA